jgi:hypothetical protein
MCKKYCCENWEGRCLVITVLLLNIGGIVVFSWALSVGLNEECKEMPDLWKHVTAIGALGKHIHIHTLSVSTHLMSREMSFRDFHVFESSDRDFHWVLHSLARRRLPYVDLVRRSNYSELMLWVLRNCDSV